jgi:hypothetical protein
MAPGRVGEADRPHSAVKPGRQGGRGSGGDSAVVVVRVLDDIAGLILAPDQLRLPIVREGHDIGTAGGIRILNGGQEIAAR